MKTRVQQRAQVEIVNDFPAVLCRYETADFGIHQANVVSLFVLNEVVVDPQGTEPQRGPVLIVVPEESPKGREYITVVGGVNGIRGYQGRGRLCVSLICFKEIHAQSAEADLHNRAVALKRHRRESIGSLAKSSVHFPGLLTIKLERPFKQYPHPQVLPGKTSQCL